MRCSLLFMLALTSAVGPSAPWTRFSSALYPYSILQPPGFQHRVEGSADVFAAGPLASPVGSDVLAVSAAPFGTRDAASYLRGFGGRHVRTVAWLHIAGQVVPLVLARLTSVVGRYSLALATFGACGLVWRLKVTFGGKQRGVSPTMLRMMRSFRLACGGRMLAGGRLTV